MTARRSIRSTRVWLTPKGSASALQVHQTEADEWAELDVAEQLVREAEAELFVYPGSAHLIADSSLAEYSSPPPR